MHEVTTQKGIGRGLAAEINFGISKFRQLPLGKRQELARLVIEEDTKGEGYARAGYEIWQLVVAAEHQEDLTEYMNDILYEGESVLSMYVVFSGYPLRAYLMTKYFREHLVLTETDCDLPTIKL